MLLAVELDDSDPVAYAKVHTADCRDLRDPEPLGHIDDLGARLLAAIEDLGWDTGDETQWPYISSCVWRAQRQSRTASNGASR